ncbi:hypothetical protein [Pseudomonas sp. S36]|uniref:hypothetical protein n=1 Tax=Pseudomonas sp. S36 TaxID=2767447 RepID=UPI001913DD32|nr:hypothetical protein [Pseudomonas sp. S36]
MTEDDAQCTRDIGDRLCLGDCDELGRDDLLGIIQAMAKAAKQHQSDPVAWMDPRSPGMHATISNEVKQHNTGFGGAPASAVSGYSIPLYTHPAPAVRQEPVAWLNTASGAVTASPVQVMDWDDESEPVQALYTHADPAEVERLRKNHREHAARL